jgi:hypothetical protein
MNISYLIYQAERPQSIAQQREADIRAGETAADLARLWRSLRHLATGRQDSRRQARPPATMPVACAIPRPR